MTKQPKTQTTENTKIEVKTVEISPTDMKDLIQKSAVHHAQNTIPAPRTLKATQPAYAIPTDSSETSHKRKPVLPTDSVTETALYVSIENDKVVYIAGEKVPIPKKKKSTHIVG